MATLILLTIPAFAMAGDFLSGVSGPIPAIYFTYWSGVWATVVLFISLAVTPARRILGLSQLIIIRRMIGVVALLYMTFHLAVWLILDRFDIPFILNDIRRPEIYLALISMLGLVALGVTSFDAAIAKMGAKAWNNLHALIYPSTAIGILHFLLSCGTVGGLPFLLTAIFFWLMGWRILDRFRKGTDPVALAGLAVAIAAISFVFELAWVTLYQGLTATETLRYTFTLATDADLAESGLAPTWQILIIGLIVAAISAALRRGTNLALNQVGGKQ